MNDLLEDFKKSISTEFDVYSIFSDLNLKKVGQGWKAKCPFHDDNTPSFVINIKENVILFHCFGCGESGDIFNYISKRNNLDLSKDFKEIVEIISNLTNTPIPNNFFKNKEITNEETKFEKYHEQLLNNTEAINHLKNRGIKDLSIFGYNSEEKIYKILSRHLNEYYIIDYIHNGTPIKYNFPKGFKKHIPFNQYKIKNGDIWLVEGIFDALCLYENYNINAVALLGSELQNKTINTLKRYDNIILALDNDKVGEKSTYKIINKLYSNGFINVFYLDYSQFEFKDINEAFQLGKSEDIIKLIDNNKKYAYKYLVEEHLQNRLKIKDDLDEIKEIDRFLKDILSYSDLIQQTVLKTYKEKVGIDIQAQFDLYKNQLITEESYSSLKSIIDNTKNFNIDKLEEIKRITDNAFSSITTIDIYKTNDIINIERPNRIKSSLITDIYYYESALSFIGARTGHRKTSLMINETINLLMDYRIAFISLEESFNWIGAKLIVNCYNRYHKENEITISDFFKNKQQYTKSIEKLANNLYILDKSHYIEDLQKYIIHLHLHYKINVFFIDYLQRISFKNSNMCRLNRQEQIKHINTILLDLAKENNLYIISGVQLNRNVTKENDIKTDNAYREAGDIEQDANLLINLWYNKDRNELKYFIAKNRNGKSGFEGILEIKPEYWLLEKNDLNKISNLLEGLHGLQ